MNIITANILFSLFSFGLILSIKKIKNDPNFIKKILSERYIGTILSLLAFYWLGFYTDIFDKDQAYTFLEKIFIYYDFLILPMTLIVYWLNSYLIPRAYACLYTFAAYEIINQALITGINSTSRFFLSCFSYVIVILMLIIIARPWLLEKQAHKLKINKKYYKVITTFFIITPIICFFISFFSTHDF